MRHIIILTDFSENSLDAAEYAINFYKKESIEFHLLHVKDSRGMMMDDLMTGNLAGDVNDSILGSAKENILDFKNKVSNLSNGFNHSFRSKVLFGPFFDVISDYCRKQDIYMLVMGTTGATGAKQVFLGSTASKVINRINTPILAVPKKTQYLTVKKILFSIDYLVDYLPITLIPLLDILEEKQAELSVVYANEKENNLTVDQQLNQKELSRILEDYNFKTHTVNGISLNNVISCLTDFLTVDLIVMIKKDKGMISKLFNMSHIRKVSYHTKKPLLILPERPILFD